MPLFLSTRNTEIIEQMDDPNCDLRLLNNTYESFSSINRLIGGWRKIYRRKIRPLAENSTNPITILDIGCGGGDILRLLNSYLKKDGIAASFTGIEPDPRAIDFANSQPQPDHIRFRKTTSTELAKSGDMFDIVLTNHVVHHLDQNELEQICNDADQLSRRLALFSDIERSDIGYGIFRTLAPLFFRDSFIAEDGATSVRRSYTLSELRETLPEPWKVERMFPYRLIATLNKISV